MKIKKRYLWPPLILFGIWGILQLMTSFLKRTPNEEIRRSLNAKGIDVRFPVIKSGDYNLSLIEAGASPSNPLVILLHGSPGSADNYLDYLGDTSLLSRVHLLAIDRAGFGYTTPVKGEPSLTEQARHIRDVLAQYGDRPAILLGHSMGGPVASRFGIDYPELTAGLILVAPSVDPALEPSTWWRKIIHSPLLSWILPKLMRVSNEELLPLRQELTTMESLWPNITCPVTVIQGTEDNLVPAGNAGFIREHAINSTRLQIDMLEGKDHFILWSEEMKVKEALYDMLDHIR